MTVPNSLFVALAIAASARGSAPEAVWLTWQRDPTTTMSIQWLDRDPDGSAVSYAAGDNDAWTMVTGRGRPLPHTNRTVHVVELRGLGPGMLHEFRIGDDAETYRFRTMPADAGEPVSFIACGDVYREALDERIYRAAAARDPAFVVLGGDIVYDNGRPGRVERWYYFLKAWTRLMRGSDDRLIPMIAVIGNHEVRGRYGMTPEEAPFFYSLFPWPGADGCGVLDFGEYMSLIVLDSGHTHPIGGRQTSWLEQALAARAARAHLFAAYHVPAYPSVRSLEADVCPEIRRHWVPLFERYGVDAAFEAHDHAYKRTHPVRDGHVADDGVIYLGDGGWGAAPRDVHDPQRTWYLAEAKSVHSFILTTVHGERRWHRGVDRDGEVIDECCDQAPRDAAP